MDLCNKPTNHIELFLPHIKLAAREWGKRSNPTIIALHGWLDNANSFEPLAQYMTEYHIVAIDWPGHGFSEHRQAHYPLYLTDYVYDLDAIIQYVNQHLEKSIYAIIGHSFGGIIAATYASLFPEYFEKLVLIEAISPLFEDGSNAANRLKRSIEQHRKLSQADERRVYSSVDMIAKVRTKLTKMPLEHSKLIVSRNLQVVDGGVCWRSDPKLKLDSPMRLGQQQAMSILKDIRSPTLAITGNNGYKSVAIAAEQLKKNFKKIHIETLFGDHHLHMNNAEEVSACVRCFFKQHVML